MKYLDLTSAFEVYAAGGNVSEHLRAKMDASGNTEAIVEIVYDLQAGFYVAFAEREPAVQSAYSADVAAVLKPLMAGADSVLDVGTGEATTLARVAPVCFADASRVLACDISWSRLHVARGHVDRQLPAPLAQRIELFVASLFALPLRSKSVDVVWTSHALEPNGGRERGALAELFRVARRWVCLFEPSWEQNSDEGRQRMERLGYVRDLPGVVASLGGVVEARVPIVHSYNPLNPTVALVIRPPASAEALTEPTDEIWACPATGKPIVPLEDVLYCANAGLAYPRLRGIPVLREEAAILATALRLELQPKR